MTRSDTHTARGAAPRLATIDRRSRRRLRELCDEVLASYRVARERDPISDGDRREAQQLLATVAPLGAR